MVEDFIYTLADGKTGRMHALKAIPTLYLLSGDKRVLLRDASVGQIEAWLRSPP